jgi:hypothetical protein
LAGAGMFDDNLPPSLDADVEINVYNIDGLINGIANGVAIALGMAAGVESMGTIRAGHLDGYTFGVLYEDEEQEDG